jgi:hypothetical protein
MNAFPLPHRLHNSAGAVRSLGVELEFAGVEVADIGRIIVALFGGRLETISRFEYKVVGTCLGTFAVEIDLALLKERSYLKFLDFMGVELDPESLRQAEDTLARVASTLVPHEIGSPPLPMTETYRLEQLRARLQAAHALGTRASLRYAFGLQFNPEIPALDAGTALDYLRAFLLLVDWLEQQAQVALARRLSPFINDFHQSYIRSVLDPDYAPSLERLIDDYIEANPTRNRPLDMLPLFAYLDPERVRRDLREAKIKIHPRPTFHYRLPNCLIDDPDWTLAREWSGWVAVDDLAQDPHKIKRMSLDYLQRRGHLVMGYDEDWAERVARDWLTSTKPSSA